MPEITVASTTDTQESVERAAGLEPETSGDRQTEESQAQHEPGARESEAESEAAPEAAETAETEEQRHSRAERRHDADADAEERHDHDKGRGVKKRLDALTRRIYEQQEELDALKASNGRGDRKDAADGDGAAPAAQPRPKPTPAAKKADGSNQYANYEEYVEDLADWKAEQRLAQSRQADINQAEQERTQQVFSAYNEAAKAARVKYEDFVEVVGRKDLRIPQAAQVAIIEAGEIGPEIAYYLGKHPELCQELTEMSPVRAAARIGQIEIQVRGSSQNGKERADLVHSLPVHSLKDASRESESSRPAAAANSNLSPKKKPQSAAPAPITPVGGSGSRNSTPLGELPYRDYKRIRDKEEAENRYR